MEVRKIGILLCVIHSDPCALWCIFSGTAVGYGIVIDGTRCTLNESPTNLDVCIQGSCQVSMVLTVTLDS